MNKVLIAGILIVSSIAAQAHGPHGGGAYYPYRYYNNSADWIAPAVLSGLLVYAATRPVVAQPPAPPTCGPWVEIRNPDGTVTQSRTCQ